MKKAFVVLLVLIFSKSLAQYPIVTDAVKNRGIYKTFEEFRDNEPSIPLENLIDRDQSGKATLFEDSTYGYCVYVTPKRNNELGNVFGFCDGEKIYVTKNKPQPVLIHAFYELEQLGKYCYYQYTYDLRLPSQNRPDTLLPKTETHVLDMATGDISKLTKKSLEKIISDKPELLSRFQKQDNKGDHLKEYLAEYLKA